MRRYQNLLCIRVVSPTSNTIGRGMKKKFFFHPPGKYALWTFVWINSRFHPPLRSACVLNVVMCEVWRNFYFIFIMWFVSGCNAWYLCEVKCEFSYIIGYNAELTNGYTYIIHTYCLIWYFLHIQMDYFNTAKTTYFW